jgi:class 3 adenylate cyclase
MPGVSGAKRVTTVLFLDMVGSTRLASQLGDDRWRTTLARFRKIVRANLKVHQGREKDTAGDGFFATFLQPASALRCAASIARDVQSIGLDVRCGVHSGEVGTVERRPGGMAVHVAARVMALAGPAEILCTTTVRDLVLGSDIGFEKRGAHELDGVPGVWEILTVNGTPGPVPEALTLEERRDRLAAMQPQGTQRSRLVLFGIPSVAVLAVVVGLLVATHGGNQPPPLAPSLLRIDESNHNKIVQSLGARPDTGNVVLGDTAGTFWQRVGDALIGRSVEDGGNPLRIEGADLGFDPTFGFGSIWTYGTGVKTNTMLVTRYDVRSGRPMQPFAIPGSPMTQVYTNAFRAFVAGPTGVWYLRYDNTKLSFIDPITNRVRSWPTGSWGLVGPAQVLPTANAVWLCDPTDNILKRFDVATDRVSARIRTLGTAACPVAADKTSVWILDRSGAQTLRQIDTKTGEQLGEWGIGPSLPGTSGLSAYAFGSIWFPVGRFVYRFDLARDVSIPIAMPAGVTAGTVVADEPSGTVWVANCDPAWCNWLPAG